MRALMVLLCLLPGTALSDTVFVFGDKGTASCGEFVAAAETSPLGQSLEGTENGIKMFSEKYVMLEFVRGFLTARNMSASSPTWWSRASSSARFLLPFVGARMIVAPGLLHGVPKVE